MGETRSQSTLRQYLCEPAPGGAAARDRSCRVFRGIGVRGTGVVEPDAGGPARGRTRGQGLFVLVTVKGRAALSVIVLNMMPTRGVRECSDGRCVRNCCTCQSLRGRCLVSAAVAGSLLARESRHEHDSAGSRLGRRSHTQTPRPRGSKPGASCRPDGGTGEANQYGTQLDTSLSSMPGCHVCESEPARVGGPRAATRKGRQT